MHITIMTIATFLALAISAGCQNTYFGAISDTEYIAPGEPYDPDSVYFQITTDKNSARYEFQTSEMVELGVTTGELEWNRGTNGDAISLSIYDAPRAGELFIKTDAFMSNKLEDICQVSPDSGIPENFQKYEPENGVFARSPVGTFHQMNVWSDYYTQEPCLFFLHWDEGQADNCM